MCRQWYALHTKPHKERQVASLLRSRNLEVFLPLLRVNPVNPRASRERPYFPNYLFAHVDLDVTGLSALQWTPGLLRMVEFGGVLGTVPRALIAQLKQRLHEIRTAGGIALQGLRVGDRVHVTDGPFQGYEGVFDVRLSGADRVRVLLELIGDYRCRRAAPRSVPVELNVGNIAKLKA
jgi:transcriptional antiterminator RfaH|tara:strand:+ start:295 stop:828 length:534 start_codon:yes stop_codon:yes gene_type:complete